MPNQSIIEYINNELARGLKRDAISQALLNSGWQQADVEEAFNTVAAVPIPPAGFSVVHGTEKEFPITNLWLFKNPIIIGVITVVGLFFGIWFPYLVLAAIINLIANPIIRSKYHYSLEDKYFIIKQGVFSKKQRNLPYGVIQNVFVKQDLFDRIFGLSSLLIEDATKGGQNKSFKLSGYTAQGQAMGSAGNKVSIPGLKKSNAEDLKNLILRKMKENPVDTQSGL